MDLSIVIPCYNEADGVPKLSRELLPVLAELAGSGALEVIFVDDGSRDETSAALRRAFGQVIQPGVSFKFERHDVNRGLGAALRTGFTAASGEIVVTADSDGTYPYANIPGLLACLTPGVDLVTASPDHPDGGVAGVPAYRLGLSRGSSLLYRWLVDQRVHTYTSLFRAYRRRVLNEVDFESDGFLAGTELLVKARLSGFCIAEYPTILQARTVGVSKARLKRTILAHLVFMGRVGLHRMSIRALVSRGPSVRRQTWTASRLSAAGKHHK